MGDRWIATAGYDNQVILWDATRKAAVQRALHDHLANQCEFSPCGKYLASSSSDYTARLWRLPDMRLVAVLGDHDDDVEMTTFSPSGELLATASRDTIVRIFDSSGRLLKRLEGHSDDVNSVAWSDDGSRVASCADDGFVFVWDVERGQASSRYSLGDNQADTVALSGDTLFVGNDDGRIVIIRGEETSTHQAHAAGIKRLVYNKQAKLLVSLSYDRSIKVWRIDGSTLTEISSSQFPSLVWARACAFSGSDRVVTGTFGSSFATFDIREKSWDLADVSQTRGINAVRYVDDDEYTVGDAGVLKINSVPTRDLGSLCNFLEVCGRRVLTGGQTGEVFDAETGEVIHQHRSPLNCAAQFSRNGTPWLAIGSYTGEVILFEFDGRAAVYRKTVSVHGNAIKGLAWRNDVLFSVCADTSARFTDTRELEPGYRAAAGHEQIANGCAAFRDGFASIARDRKLRLWADSGQALAFDSPHSHSVKCVSASDDGLWLATGSYNGLLAIFDVEQRRWTRVDRLTAAGISSVCYAPGDRFVASSYDGNTYPYPVPRGAPARFALAS
jgi:WD40 repeat protein